jgi:hypothetical protein
MVSMLDARKALSQLTLVMVVHIREIGDTRALRTSILGTVLQLRTQYIPHRFAAGCVAAFLDQGVEGFGQFLIQ